MGWWVLDGFQRVHLDLEPLVGLGVDLEAVHSIRIVGYDVGQSHVHPARARFNSDQFQLRVASWASVKSTFDSWASAESTFNSCTSAKWLLKRAKGKVWLTLRAPSRRRTLRAPDGVWTSPRCHAAPCASPSPSVANTNHALQTNNYFLFFSAQKTKTNIYNSIKN